MSDTPTDEREKPTDANARTAEEPPAPNGTTRHDDHQHANPAEEAADDAAGGDDDDDDQDGQLPTGTGTIMTASPWWHRGSTVALAVGFATIGMSGGQILVDNVRHRQDVTLQEARAAADAQLQIRKFRHESNLGLVDEYMKATTPEARRRLAQVLQSVTPPDDPTDRAQYLTILDALRRDIEADPKGGQETDALAKQAVALLAKRQEQVEGQRYVQAAMGPGCSMMQTYATQFRDSGLPDAKVFQTKDGNCALVLGPYEKNVAEQRRVALRNRRIRGFEQPAVVDGGNYTQLVAPGSAPNN